jgi:hypothetical protein
VHRDAPSSQSPPCVPAAQLFLSCVVHTVLERVAVLCVRCGVCVRCGLCVVRVYIVRWLFLLVPPVGAHAHVFPAHLRAYATVQVKTCRRAVKELSAQGRLEAGVLSEKERAAHDRARELKEKYEAARRELEQRGDEAAALRVRPRAAVCGFRFGACLCVCVWPSAALFVQLCPCLCVQLLVV